MHCDVTVTYSLESTAGGIFSKLALVMFQSTHSLRSATHERPKARPYYLVSIHALMRVRLLGVYDTNYQQCNGRFAPTSHGRYKDSRS